VGLALQHEYQIIQQYFTPEEHEEKSKQISASKEKDQKQV